MPFTVTRSPETSAPAATARLAAEKLDVYAVALEFHALAADLVPTRRQAVLRDQLERASLSIVLNIAEGAGRRAPADKARFYAMARGSAAECGGILDVLLARQIIAPTAHCRLRLLLVRVVQMLTKLAARMTEEAARAGGERPFP